MTLPSYSSLLRHSIFSEPVTRCTKRCTPLSPRMIRVRTASAAMLRLRLARMTLLSIANKLRDLWAFGRPFASSLTVSSRPIPSMPPAWTASYELCASDEGKPRRSFCKPGYLVLVRYDRHVQDAIDCSALQLSHNPSRLQLLTMRVERSLRNLLDSMIIVVDLRKADACARWAVGFG
jgi:hypothetical protein